MITSYLILLTNRRPKAANHRTAPSSYQYSTNQDQVYTKQVFRHQHPFSTIILLKIGKKKGGLTSSGRTFFPVVNAGLSIRTMKSTFLKKGFLNGMGFPFPCSILYGPFGCGKVDFP